MYLLTVALQGFAANGIFAVLFNLYLLRLGYGPEFIGLVVAAGQTAFCFSCLLTGAFGARWGSRRPLLVGFALHALGYGLASLAELIPLTGREGWLLATYVLFSVGSALHGVHSNPFLMSATGVEERQHAFSVQAAVGPLAGFAGSLFGGILPRFFAAALGAAGSEATPYRYAILLSALLLIPIVPVLWHTREAPVEPAPRRAGRRDNSPLIVILMWAFVSLIRHSGRAPANTFFNVYLDAGLHLATAQIGLLTGAAKLVAVPAALVTPFFVARWGRCRTVVWGTIGVALSLLLLALVPHWSAAGVGFIGFTAFFAITSPVCSVYNQELVPPAWRPTMAGIVNTAIGLGTAAMSLGGGYAIAALGYRTLFLSSVALSACSALFFWLFFGVPRGELARQNPKGRV